MNVPFDNGDVYPMSAYLFLFPQAGTVEKQSKQTFKIRHVQIDELPRTIKDTFCATECRKVSEILFLLLDSY